MYSVRGQVKLSQIIVSQDLFEFGTKGLRIIFKKILHESVSLIFFNSVQRSLGIIINVLHIRDVVQGT